MLEQMNNRNLEETKKWREKIDRIISLFISDPPHGSDKIIGVPIIDKSNQEPQPTVGSDMYLNNKKYKASVNCSFSSVLK